MFHIYWGEGEGENSVLIWQYDLPQYGSVQTTNDGYYLVSKSDSEYSSLFEQKMKHFGIEIGADLDIQYLTRLVNQRGVIDLKKLIAGGSSTVGEIGMLVSQLLLVPPVYYPQFKGILKAKDDQEISLCMPIS